MRITILIPARYASQRYPGKPLAPLRGPTGEVKSLIQRTHEAALAVSGADRVAVATDDARIADAAKRFGADVVMTSLHCKNGTERCAEAVPSDATDGDIIVNLQGDAPLTPPWFVEELIGAMRDAPDMQVATPVLRCDERALRGFVEDRRAGRVGGTTAVFDRHGRALYFSKEVVPYTPQVGETESMNDVYHHVGVYAYRPPALRAYASWQTGPLERAEGLEQLRFLENGWPVACVEVEARGAHFWELNNPVDVPRIEAVLAERGTP